MSNYFVVYENRPICCTKDYVPLVSNVILVGIHRLKWLRATSQNYDDSFVTYIHWWGIISDEDVVNRVNTVPVIRKD